MESTLYRDEGASPDYLLSVNDRMLQVRERLLELAQTGCPVVLCGEKGLGKESLAQSLHRWSARSSGAFVRVNAQLLANGGSGENAEAGENGSHPLRRAVGGTLYVSNAEGLAPDARSRIAAQFAALEAERPGRAPRLVVSVEASPTEAADAVAGFLPGESVALELPPLRDRPEDIGLLAQHLLQVYGAFHTTRIKQLRSSLVDLFKQYAWPGNVRELERVIRRFLVLEDESAIRRELEAKIRAHQVEAAEGEDYPAGTPLAEIGRRAAQRAEARAIRRALERTRWNKKAAAHDLGVSYKSLLNKVRDYRLDA
jgi:DNA-binding NtrC family response regulator